MDTHQVKNVICNNTMTPTQRHREMEMRGEQRCGQGGESGRGAPSLSHARPPNLVGFTTGKLHVHIYVHRHIYV